jgi:uncharacterized protein (DUF983 family)
MLLGDWQYWLLWLAVIVINVIGVYVAWRGLFADRARGRRRCPKCWFDMTYTPSRRCGECGFEGHAEHVFLRTRRHYRQVAVAILICLLVAVWVNERLSTKGWASMIPTRILISAMPVSGSYTSPMNVELRRRINAGSLSYAQWESLVKACAEGDAWTAPPDDDWRGKYGQLIHETRRYYHPQSIAYLDRRSPDESRTAGSDGTDDDPHLYSSLEEYLLDIPPHIAFSTREVWPDPDGVTVELKMRDWWPVGTVSRIHITPKIDGMAPVTLHRSPRVNWNTGHVLFLPTMPQGTTDVAFDVRIERRERKPDDDPTAPDVWTKLGRTTHTVRITVDAGSAPAMKAIADDETLDNAVRATFAQGIVRWQSGRSPVRFYFNPGRTLTTTYSDVAFGCRVDLVRDDEVVRGLDIWWRGGVTTGPLDVGWTSEDDDDDERLRQVNADDGRWALRVTGLRELALRAGDAPRYWTGELDIPLRVHERTDEAPTPHWWEEQEKEQQEGSRGEVKP